MKWFKKIFISKGFYVNTWKSDLDLLVFLLAFEANYWKLDEQVKQLKIKVTRTWTRFIFVNSIILILRKMHFFLKSKNWFKIRIKFCNSVALQEDFETFQFFLKLSSNVCWIYFWCDSLSIYLFFPPRSIFDARKPRSRRVLSKKGRRDNKKNLSINIMKKANVRTAMWYREMNISVCAIFVQIFSPPFLLSQCLSWILFVQSNVEDPKNILLALKKIFGTIKDFPLHRTSFLMRSFGECVWLKKFCKK